MSRISEEGVELHRTSKGERDECKGVQKVTSGEEFSPVLHHTGVTKTGDLELPGTKEKCLNV